MNLNRLVLCAARDSGATAGAAFCSHGQEVVPPSAEPRRGVALELAPQARPRKARRYVACSVLPAPAAVMVPDDQTWPLRGPVWTPGRQTASRICPMAGTRVARTEAVAPPGRPRIAPRGARGEQAAGRLARDCVSPFRSQPGRTTPAPPHASRRQPQVFVHTTVRSSDRASLCAPRLSRARANSLYEPAAQPTVERFKVHVPAVVWVA